MYIREQFLGTIAFAGDLTMGQSPDHSPMTACIAARIAKMDGQPPDVVARAAQLAMLRWGGCTANAIGFAELFGDDVLGRREMLAGRDPFVSRPSISGANTHDLPSWPPEGLANSSDAIFYGKFMPLVYQHCEVITEIARRARFGDDVIEAFDDLFEFWDGSGMPVGKTGGQFDRCVQYVWLANDIDVFSRFHGPKTAAVMVRARATSVYNPDLAEHAAVKIEDWLQDIQASPALRSGLWSL